MAVFTIFSANFLNQRPLSHLPDKKLDGDVANGEDNTAPLNIRGDNNNETDTIVTDDQIKPGVKNKKDPLVKTLEEQNAKAGVPTKQNINQAPERTDQIIAMDGYVLSIHATKNTWVKVIADDKAAVKYRLKIGDRLDLTAISRFNMLIGDANGVRLTLNGKPVPVSGKSGQIVNIEVP